MPGPDPTPPAVPIAIANEFRECADQLDRFLNTLASSQALSDPRSRALRQATALGTLLQHPAMDKVAHWLQKELRAGNCNSNQAAHMFMSVIERAREIVGRETLAARSRLLLPRTSQEDVDKLLAFGSVVVQILRSRADFVAEEPTLWHHGEMSYSADRLNPVVVSHGEAAVLKEFARADGARDTRALECVVGNAARVMRRLAERFPGAVRLPNGVKGAGYYVRVRRAAGG